jgi:bacteriorhodopsin
MNILEKSAIGSLVVQLITGLIEYTGLFYKVDPNDEIVKEILSLELIVQGIEFIFYAYLVYKIFTNTLQTNITSQRYIDWAITTPFMLISFVLFFKYLKQKDRKITLLESLNEERKNIIAIVIANFLMLLFGYAAEVGLINNPLAVSIGFLPFAFIFKQLYANYVSKDNISIILFYFIFAIWGLYGVAAVLPFVLKNTFYNILDLFSKNAYGLFLYFYIQNIQV